MRIILQPSFFTRNILPAFQISKRTYDLYFEYPWSEKDEVTIELPEGYQLETHDSPRSMTFGNVGKYEASMKQRGSHQWIYQRSFRFGDNGGILLPVAAYPDIKQSFDDIHQQDNHVVTITRKPS